MEKINNVDEEGNIIGNSWDCDFQFLINYVEEYPDKLDKVLNVIIFKAVSDEGISIIKNLSIYKIIYNKVFRSSDILLKIHFILNYEIDLLEEFFDSYINMANSIMNLQYTDDIKISYLSKLSFKTNSQLDFLYVTTCITKLLDPYCDSYANRYDYYTYYSDYVDDYDDIEPKKYMK